MTQAQNNTQTKEPEILTLSSSPGKAMQEMMDIIDVLRRVYVRETEALTAADTKTFLSIQEEKLAAARNYQTGIKQILARKDEMRQADPTLRQRLEEMQGEFTELAAKNAQALQRMNRGIERLGDVIRSAAKRAAQDERSFSYDATGIMRNTEGKTVSTGISETA